MVRLVKTSLTWSSRRWPADEVLGGLPRSLVDDRRRYALTQRTFGRDHLDQLEALLNTADRVVALREALELQKSRTRLVVALRHDMDKDAENAVRLAEWEAARGYRATYFVRHTDWYWSTAASRGPSTYIIRHLERIQSLGHEIGIHNDAVTAALERGGDPTDILRQQIDALREHGFDIRGTAAHGSKLCRVVGYVNSEIFIECARPRLGDPRRTLTYAGSGEIRREVSLRPIEMSALGLDYEASFFPGFLYISDVGGRWTKPFDDIARRFVETRGRLQILVHPVYWALSGEPFRVVTGRTTLPAVDRWPSPQ